MAHTTIYAALDVPGAARHDQEHQDRGIREGTMLLLLAPENSRGQGFQPWRTNWVDSTVYFLEHPMTELTIGTMAVALTFGHNSVRRVQPRVE